MSKVGNSLISLGPSVKFLATDEGLVTVTGPKGTLSMHVKPEVSFSVNDSQIAVIKNAGASSAYHGLYRALVANMVEGVSSGFKKQLQLIGVGYKAEVKGAFLELSLGYSHSTIFVLPRGVAVSVALGSDKVYTITLESIDKQLLGQVAQKIKSFRPVEPYKGKGIRVLGEFVRRKAGKTSSKK